MGQISQGDLTLSPATVVHLQEMGEAQDPFDGLSAPPHEVDLFTAYSNGASPVSLPLLPQCGPPPPLRCRQGPACTLVFLAAL